MAMLYAEGVKKRLLIGARTKVGVERNADRVDLGRWGMMQARGAESNLNGVRPCFLAVNRKLLWCSESRYKRLGHH
jgi:hypothetical protein